MMDIYESLERCIEMYLDVFGVCQRGEGVKIEERRERGQITLNLIPQTASLMNSFTCSFTYCLTTPATQNFISGHAHRYQTRCN